MRWRHGLPQRGGRALPPLGSPKTRPGPARRTPIPVRQRLLTAIALVALLPAAAFADTATNARDVENRLRAAERVELGQQWLDARRLERHGRDIEVEDPATAVELYLKAATLFSIVAEEHPELSAAYWRCARVYWGAGDALPLEEKERRIRYFERAEEWAQRGIDADPECAECMLWKFIAMGRLGTTRGAWTAIRRASEMAELLERGIELEPTHADSENNSTLGNLHYSSAIFYRVLPDWFFMRWIAGVRGDKERALEHSREALSLHPARLDFLIEVGTQLLCLGSTRDDPAQIAEGSEVMRAALLREPSTQSEEREIAAARIMLDTPRKSCGYSGDTWVEIDRETAERAAADDSNRAGIGSAR